MQSVLAMVNVFSEQFVQKVGLFDDVPNNVWSERAFVRVKKYSSPPQRKIDQISTFSDSNMDFHEISLNIFIFHSTG